MTTKKTIEVNKPVFDTIINTAAIALTAWGTQQIMTGNYIGCVIILFGVALELIKYLKRKYI